MLGRWGWCDLGLSELTQRDRLFKGAANPIGVLYGSKWQENQSLILLYSSCGSRLALGTATKASEGQWSLGQIGQVS